MESLTNEELGNLISAVGNSESKALLLVGIRNGGIYSRHDCYRLMSHQQGKPYKQRKDSVRHEIYEVLSVSSDEWLTIDNVLDEVRKNNPQN